MGPVTSVSPGRVELRQSTSNLLALPIFIAIVLLVLIIRLLMPPGGSTVIIVVAAVLLVPDIFFALYLLRDYGSTLVVTADDITVTRRSDVKRPTRPRVIHRTDGSKLSFRTARNGPRGADYTAAMLMLRDNATGDEVYAGAFGRRKVQQACESHGWSFS